MRFVVPLPLHITKQMSSQTSRGSGACNSAGGEQDRSRPRLVSRGWFAQFAFERDRLHCSRLLSLMIRAQV